MGPPVVAGNQLVCFIDPGVSYCWEIVVEFDYIGSKLLILGNVDPSFPGDKPVHFFPVGFLYR